LPETSKGRPGRSTSGALVCTAVRDLLGPMVDAARERTIGGKDRGLSGTERFLKLQNDAVRAQASAEADALRSRVRHLQERVDHLLPDNEQYRRVIGQRHPL
jgi:hypothetical protein